MPFFAQLPHHLGGYTLTRFLHAEGETEWYEAIQARMNRPVILEILPPGTDRQRESDFLQRAQLCAATDRLPHTARVVESLRAESVWFLAQERPSGYALSDLQALGQMLTAQQACLIIKTVAEVYTLCEEAGLTAAKPSASGIYLSADNSICLLSPLASKKTDGSDLRRALAECLRPMRPVGMDGEQRILTLLQWLTDGYEDGTLVEWNTFRETCETIHRQLEGDIPVQPVPEPRLTKARTRRRNKRTLRSIMRAGVLTATALTLICGIAATGLFFPLGEQQTLPAAHGGFLTVKRHGITQRIMQSPVSIADYEQFLLALQTMSTEQLAEINRDIPEEHADHIPAEWEQLIAGARRQNDRTHDSPMVQVSYWDALAYSRYIGNGAALPDAAQLQVVQANGGASGLLEWSATVTGENPLNLYPANTPLLIEMAEGARPIPADSAAMRSPETGFRLVFPSP